MVSTPTPTPAPTPTPTPTPVPTVMGIINLSPLSFYQPSVSMADALEKALRMVDEGADILDIGAVATNPAISTSQSLLDDRETRALASVSIQTELDMIIPLIEALKQRVDITLSVDTSNAIVMEEAIKAGAQFINDQRALSEKNTLETVIKYSVSVCLMHHFQPIRKPNSCTREELLTQIIEDCIKNIERCLSAGMQSKNIIIDPGFGGGSFGKSCEENFYLLAHLERFVAIGYPVLVGVSRKSMFGELLNKPPEERLSASISAAVIAAEKGAAIIRVHDVKETVDAMKVLKVCGMGYEG